MSRERLPNRRRAETFDFVHIISTGGYVTYSANVGFYDDGRVGEVFLSCGKSGSDTDLATRDSAIALSLALQYGCPLEEIAPAFLRKSDGSPEGPLGTLVRIILKEQENDRRVSEQESLDGGTDRANTVDVGQGDLGN